MRTLPLSELEGIDTSPKSLDPQTALPEYAVWLI